MKVSEEGTRIKLTWNNQDNKDIEKAREYFEKLTRQGWIAARYDGEYRRVLELEPEHEELWFIPLAEGG